MNTANTLMLSASLLVASLSFGGSAKADTLIGNMDAPDSSIAGVIGVIPNNTNDARRSVSFTVIDEGAVLETVELRLRAIGNFDPSAPFVSIWSDDGSGFPGTELISLSGAEVVSGFNATYTFTAQEDFVFEAGSLYHLVLAGDGNGGFGWLRSDPDTDPEGLAFFGEYNIFNSDRTLWRQLNGQRHKFAINVVFDSDGDGVTDDVDLCPDSILTPTVIIGNIDTGIINEVSDEGCSYADRIADFLVQSADHGDFVSSVSAFANELKKQGLISGKEKGRITSAAAKSKK